MVTEYTIESCGYPGDPSNGQTSLSPDEESVIGDVITIDCIPGYELQGIGNRSCEEDGDWSPELTTCMSKNPHQIKKRNMKHASYHRIAIKYCFVLAK